MSTMIGVALALCGGIIQSVGFILQKKGHNKVKELQIFSVTQVPIWWFGILTYQIGNASRAVSLSFAAQSIISPLLAFNIAVNSILAHFILKEYISKKDVVAIIAIILGLVMLIVFGPSDTDENDSVDLTISELKSLFKETDYIIFVSCLTAIMCTQFVISKCVEYKNFVSDENEQIVAGKRFLLLSYTAISGYFRANNTLFIKSLMIIITSSFESKQNHQQNVNDYVTYLIVILWMSCLLSGEYFRQKALSYFGASFVIPLDILFSVIFSVFLGGFFFNEFSEMHSIVYTTLFFVGLLITLCSVFILSYDVSSKLDELYDKFIKVIYVNPDSFDSVQFQQSKIIVVPGIISEYFSNLFYKEIPFFRSIDIDITNPINLKAIELELTNIGSQSPQSPQSKHEKNCSYSWANTPKAVVFASRTYFQSKMILLLPGLFIFIFSIFMSAKFEISGYHFISIWIVLWNVALLLFLCIAFMSQNLREIRSISKNMNGFSRYISFTQSIEDKVDRPITSVCRFAGVRGSSQDMTFASYIFGEAALTMAILAIKTNERGQALFTDTAWNQGRRTDIMLLIGYVLSINILLLYFIAVVEHGTVGHRIHLFCGLMSQILGPFGFLIQQNGSIFSIVCLLISFLSVAVYKINGVKAVSKSDDPVIVHRQSLMNLSVETGMIVCSSVINALVVWAMEGDKIYFT